MLRRNVPLADRVSFRAGGAARFLIEPKTADEAERAFLALRARGVPCFVQRGATADDDGIQQCEPENLSEENLRDMLAGERKRLSGRARHGLQQDSAKRHRDQQPKDRDE